MYRNILIMLAAAVLGVGVVACGSAAPRPSAQPAVSSPSPAAAPSAPAHAPVTAHSSPRPAASLRVLTEPQAGIGPIYQLITGAHSSVDLSMYELADPTAEADLAADVARGVNVRVILDQHLEKSARPAQGEQLAAARADAATHDVAAVAARSALPRRSAIMVVPSSTAAAQDSSEQVSMS